jgi:hypothetical protein
MIFQHMKFQSITLTALVTLPLQKFALLVFLRLENGQHFLTKFPKIYQLVQKLFGHTHRHIHTIYSHNTYIYVPVALHIQDGEVSCNYYWRQEILDIFMHIGMKLMIVGGTIWEMLAHPK